MCGGCVLGRRQGFTASRVQNRAWRVLGGAQAEAPEPRRTKGINHREAQEGGECAHKDVDMNSSLSSALEYSKM